MADRDLTARFSASTAGFSTGTNALKQKLTELNTSMEQTKQAVKQANSEMKEYQKELQNLRKETQNGATATNEQRNRMQQLRDNIARTTSQLGTMRTAEQELRSQINSTNRELQNQQSAAQQVQSAAANMGDVLKANLWSSAIQAAVSKLTSSLKSAAEYCYNVGSSFEAGMSQVAAISGATASELDQLTAKAKELGASTKFTATETAQAMNYMAMAGWNAEQMLSGIDGVMSLAAASGGDLAQVSDIVTDAITAFGLKAEDVGHFSDVLAAASANANTNVAMMGETFQYCAPIAGALGFSIEDVAEAIGLMANSGIKSSMAGTALRTLFTKLSDDIKITGDSLGEVTIQTSNADGTMRSLTDILTDMRAAFAQLSQSERSNAAESIAGKYAMTGLLALMNSGADDVDKLRTAIEKCDGSSANMADTMQNNAAGAVIIMQSALEGLGLAVYDKFGDQLRSKIDEFTNVFSDITNRIDAGEFDQTFDRIARAVGGAADQLANFARKDPPTAIENLANLISSLVEYRNVIIGVVASMVTFKAAMAVSRTITALATSIRAVVTATTTAKTAVEALTVAQAANNTVAAANPYLAVLSAISALVVGIISFTAATGNATESIEELNNKAKELNETAKQSDKAAREVKDLVDEYRNIKDAADDTEEAKQRLKSIQDTLIDTYDAEAEKIDLINGKYSDQIQILDKLIDKKSQDAIIQARSSMSTIKLAEQQESSFIVDKYQDGIEDSDALKKFTGYMADYLGNGIAETGMGEGTEFYFTRGTTYQKRYEVSRDIAQKLQDDADAYAAAGDHENEKAARLILEQIMPYYNENKEMYDSYQSAQDIVDYYNNGGDDKDESDPGADGDGVFTPGAWIGAEYADKKKQADEAKKLATGIDWTDFDSVKAYYKYLLDTEQIEESEYYDRIEEYNDKLQKDSDPAKWRSTASEIYKGRNKETSGKSGSGSGKDPNEEKYDSEKKYLKWRLDMGYVEEDEYYEQLAVLRDKYLDESSDKWRSATLEIHQYQERKAQETQKAEADGEAEKLEKYQSEKEYLKWRLDMGYITEEEYYGNLARLRDRYLDESSEEWRSATLAIHKYQEQKAEEARKAEEQRNKEKLDKITEQYNRAISDINDEMKQHSRDREDEDIDKKIADIDRQLEYDRLDDYSRSQLEKKKQELYDEKAETQWQREHEDLKDELKTVYTMTQDIYENGTAELKSILSVASVVFGAVGAEASQVASTSSTVNNNSVNVVMNAVSQTADQIAGAVVRMISSGI